MNNSDKNYCGFVAIVGRTNVGKSTLFNNFMNYSLSITCNKAQTTRHNILGVKTDKNCQIVFIDTPGLHNKKASLLNRYMLNNIKEALIDPDAVILVVSNTWHRDDEKILLKIMQNKLPIFIIINKIDLLDDKKILLPYIKKINNYLINYSYFYRIIPLSARRKGQTVALLKQIYSLLPENNFYFPKEQLSDKPDDFFIAEWIRQKLTKILGAELPYGLTVTIDSTKQKKPNLLHISAIIWTCKKSHKPIIIGKQGENLKKVGVVVRKLIEQRLKKSIYLQLWVKVKPNWTNDPKQLKILGY